jgi:hypothetical protein
MLDVLEAECFGNRRHRQIGLDEEPGDLVGADASDFLKGRVV